MKEAQEEEVPAKANSVQEGDCTLVEQVQEERFEIGVGKSALEEGKANSMRMGHEMLGMDNLGGGDSGVRNDPCVVEVLERKAVDKGDSVDEEGRVEVHYGYLVVEVDCNCILVENTRSWM